MSRALTPAHRAALARRMALATTIRALDERAKEWFPKQRRFYGDKARLKAAICSRRAGKTRGGCLAMVREAATTRGGRFLYINETQSECRKMAWHGLRGDGMYSLVVKLGLNAKCDAQQLTIYFPEVDSWIFLMGADDEGGVRKALGLAYHRVWWDEAQKIPPKLEQTIREVLMPTLLDFGGCLMLTGTPSRQMAGLFYNVTRTDGRALKRWSVHRWTLLDNPHFGRAQPLDVGGIGWIVVLDKAGVEVGRVQDPAEAERMVADLRHRDGLRELQQLLATDEGEPDLDSPIIRREGKGEWVHEDALYVYDVHKIKSESILYAPARWRGIVLRVPRVVGESIEIEEMGFDRFPDLEAAARDLPFYVDGRDYFIGAAVDIGYDPDPFAFTVAAWSLKDPVLYEVASWKHGRLDFYAQAAVMRHIQSVFNVGVFAADAGGSAKPMVAGWSKEWQTRYGIPLEEMEKSKKGVAIEACNADIRRGQYKMRQGGYLYEEMGRVQWSVLKTSTGQYVEDPSIPNDVSDSGLYVHRRSFQHRFRPPPPEPEPGTPEHDAEVERRIEKDMDDEWEVRDHWG